MNSSSPQAAPHPLTAPHLRHSRKLQSAIQAPQVPHENQEPQCSLDVLRDPNKFYASVRTLSISSVYSDATPNAPHSEHRLSGDRHLLSTSAHNGTVAAKGTPPHPSLQHAIRRSTSLRSTNSKPIQLSSRLSTRTMPTLPTTTATTNVSNFQGASPIDASLDSEPRSVQATVTAAAFADARSSSMEMTFVRRSKMPGPSSSSSGVGMSRSKSVLGSLRSMWLSGGVSRK
ncbi:hypothetical protein BJ741DRAFT_603516 [Chytriomyces cf. hyalinus JEL632]|nr:hypothetical protein BJ741DRAFT_603516 [Chytriomyces cf. hyalinus JEL632]